MNIRSLRAFWRTGTGWSTGNASSTWAAHSWVISIRRWRTTRSSTCTWTQRWSSSSRTSQCLSWEETYQVSSMQLHLETYSFIYLIYLYLYVFFSFCFFILAVKSFEAFAEDTRRGHAAELLHHLPPGAQWDTAKKVGATPECSLKIISTV